MYPSTALYYGLRTPTGHAFLEPDWKALLVQVDPSVMLSATLSDFSASLNQNTIGRQPILDRMGVKYFVLPPRISREQLSPLRRRRVGERRQWTDLVYLARTTTSRRQCAVSSDTFTIEYVGGRHRECLRCQRGTDNYVRTVCWTRRAGRHCTHDCPSW